MAVAQTSDDIPRIIEEIPWKFMYSPKPVPAGANARKVLATHVDVTVEFAKRFAYTGAWTAEEGAEGLCPLTGRLVSTKQVVIQDYQYTDDGRYVVVLFVFPLVLSSYIEEFGVAPSGLFRAFASKTMKLMKYCSMAMLPKSTYSQWVPGTWPCERPCASNVLFVGFPLRSGKTNAYVHYTPRFNDGHQSLRRRVYKELQAVQDAIDAHSPLDVVEMPAQVLTFDGYIPIDVTGAAPSDVMRDKKDVDVGGKRYRCREFVWPGALPGIVKDFNVQLPDRFMARIHEVYMSIRVAQREDSADAKVETMLVQS